ncbi:cytochrome o ubiquinol oxidase subunit IV [Trinickia sp. EG282A]|uniref:cytochrome o ubiquinol oxidase subunit IV n=1 Tax=Trinickia sp. EG282A TaxID=3237013 RepID=UPI0034D2A7E7
MTHSSSLPLTARNSSVVGYIVGFSLAVLLTAGSFILATHRSLPPETAMIVLGALAFVQIVVHLVAFLHLDFSRGQRWNVLAFCYAAFAALFLIFGTLWVMHNVSIRMMSR